MVLAGAATAGSSLLAALVTLTVSVFLRADLGAGFSMVVVLTFLVVTLGSDAPGRVLLAYKEFRVYPVTNSPLRFLLLSSTFDILARR